MQPVEFNAPWSRKLKTGTIIYAAVLCAFAIAGVVLGFKRPSIWQLALIVLPPLGIALASLFVVRGYTLTDKEIQAKRLLWTTRLPLDALQVVEGDADAMHRMFAVAGNQGFFSYSGYFWNRATGFFRALATDPSRAVVLRYPAGKVVITPHDPQQFIVRARTLLNTGGFPAG